MQEAAADTAAPFLQFGVLGTDDEAYPTGISSLPSTRIIKTSQSAAIFRECATAMRPTVRRRKSRADIIANRAGINPGRLAKLAKPHGIFILFGDIGIDYLDTATGKSLARWYPSPYPHFLIDDVNHPGSAVACLKAIVAPYDLKLTEPLEVKG